MFELAVLIFLIVSVTITVIVTKKDLDSTSAVVYGIYGYSITIIYAVYSFDKIIALLIH